MLKVNGLEINVEPIQLVEDLKFNLNNKGIDLLSTIKPGVDNVQFSCPSHKGGQERKPSCGMLTKDVYKNGKKIEAGTVHCFTCGYTAPLHEFISFCFGVQDHGIYGNKWLKANYTTTLLQQDRKFELLLDRNTTVTTYTTIPDEILDTYRYLHPYIINRGISADIVELFDIGYDIEGHSITFPVSNIHGEVKWVQTRSITSKFYYIPSGISKTDFLYGAYECLLYNVNNEPVYICESPINALTYWTHGKFAVALFGTGGGQQYELLRKLPFRHYILSLDNDDAGKSGSRKILNCLKTYKLLSKVQYEKDCYLDINDLGIKALDLPIVPLNY